MPPTTPDEYLAMWLACLYGGVTVAAILAIWFRGVR